MSRIRRSLAVLVGLTIAVPALALGGQSASAAQTSFAFMGSGFTSSVRGGSLPVSSGRTAYATLGCTNQTGLERTNTAATVDIDGLPIRLGASETSVRTLGFSNGAATVSTNTIADVQVFGGPGNRLTIDGLRSVARAANRNGEFTSSARFTLVSASLTLGGVSTPVTKQRLREGIVLPGIAEIELADNVERVSDTGARSVVTGLKITVLAIPNPAVVKLGRASAQINDGNPIGLFSGAASVVKATGLGNGVRSGPLAYQPLPCRGTNGNWRHDTIAVAGLPGVVRARGLDAATFGLATAEYNSARSVAKVAKATLLDGRLVVRGLVVRANVRKTADGTYTRNSDGSSLASIRLDGEVIDVPDPGETILIPGAVRIRFQTVDRSPTGIAVYGLRIELLGSGGVIVQLAKASAFIR